MAKRTPLENLERLHPAARQVALVYGIAWPVTPGQNRILKWLADAGLIKAHSTIGTDLRDTVNDLVTHGILRRAGNQGVFQADRDVATHILKSAAQDGLLDRLLTAMSRDTYLQEWNAAEAAAEMYARAALATGNHEWLRYCRRRIPWDVLLEPGFQACAATVPEEHAELAILSALSHCGLHLRNIDLFLDAVETRTRHSTSVMAHVAWWRILQGQFDHTLNWLAQRSQTQGGRMVEAGARALINCLRGDDQAALSSILRTLEEARGASRKKLIFPDHPAFTLSLLSLVRMHTPESEGLLRDLLASAHKLKCENIALHVPFAALNHLRGIEDTEIRFYHPEHDVIALLAGLRLAWADQLKEPWAHESVQRLEKIADDAPAMGFRWLAAQAAALIDHAPDDETASLESLGCISLKGTIPVIEDWEIGLSALETLARAARTKQNDGNAAPSSRLAWMITLEGRYDALGISPREQQFQRGRWSKGRAVSLKKLKFNQGYQHLLTSRDEAIIAHISSEVAGWNRSESYFVNSHALKSMAGHPAVIDEDGNPLEVIGVEPALIIDEHMDGGLTATLSPWPESDQEVQAIYQRGDHRVQVISLTEGMRTLRSVIPQTGLTLPAYARGRLMDVVETLAGELKIHSSVAGTTASAKSVEPDPSPWVQLTPAGTGLNVRLLVEPIPGSAVQFDPASGTELVFGQVAQERLQARRNLVRELATAHALIETCPELTGIDVAGWRIELTTPEDCLELLDQLQQANARCLWPQGQNYRVVGRAGASSLSVVVKSGQEWFAASGELKVDEEQAISLAKLMMLLEENRGSRFIRVGEGEYVALSKTFRRQLETLRGISALRGNTMRINPLGAHAIEDLMDESSFESDVGWQTQLKRLEDARIFEPELPATLQADLRPYQEDGVRWLARLAAWGVGACLADDMGLGKTVQTLGLLLLRASNGPALVVAPTSLVDNWRSEARRFAPTLNIVVHAGTVNERQSLLQGRGPFDLVITTYGVLQNDIERMQEINWATVVIDEAQAVKNAATKRSQAVRGLRGEFRVATTGTPIQNNLMDLHALFSFLNPGLLGSAEQFRSLYAIPIERDDDTEARLRLSRLIAPFILRRTKSEVLDDLPSRTEIVRPVTLSTEEAQFYEALRRQALAALSGVDLTDGGGPQQIQVLAHLTKLRLACCHPLLVHDTGIRESAKHTEFMELLDELLQGRHKVLVFSQFVKHLKLIEERLIAAKITYQYLDGQTPREERTRRVAAFQGGEGDVFLISLKAGGTGLNLTAADYVIHMDPWWNPAAEDQASDRAHRIGQTRPVTIYRLVARGTIEEQIVELHHRKRDLADRLLEGTDSNARLDTEELLALLREPITMED